MKSCEIGQPKHQHFAFEENGAVGLDSIKCAARTGQRLLKMKDLSIASKHGVARRYICLQMQCIGRRSGLVFISLIISRAVESLWYYPYKVVMRLYL